MSSTILELIRYNHEYSEHLEQRIGEELDIKPNGQKSKIYQQHKVNLLLNKLIETNKQLTELYEDKDNSFKEELVRMKGINNMFDTFYSSVQSTKEYYNKYPSKIIVDIKLSIDEDLNNLKVPFSGEEVFGKYLDLHQFFLMYCNLMKENQQKENLDYIQYLDRFNMFFHIKNNLKQSRAYLEYLNSLLIYLCGFFKRINPLKSYETLEQEWQNGFEGKFGKIEADANGSNGVNKSESQPLRLGMFNDVQELEALGMNRLKEALEALGLKCGGTLKERAARLFSVRGKRVEDYPPGILANSNTKKHKLEHKSGEAHDIKIKWIEFKISALCEVMSDVVSATKRHAEQQQTRSVEEKEAEILEEELGLLPDVQEDEEVKNGQDDETPIYNPRNVPLGWDGKPIPYWLFKLHGLGVEFKCEVCGNQSYWGRKAFDKHFQEWKHAHGMRCLGVPNTKHFHDITKIEDVLLLYNKMKATLTKEQFSGDMEEEFEDTDGNILNRQTYEDFARQGLL